MSDEMITSLVGLLGVLVGGLITFGIQFYFSSRAEDQTTIGLMRKFQFLLLDTINDVLRWHSNIDQEIPNNHTGPIWPLVRPISNFHSELLLADTACLALFCDGKSDDFLHKVTDLISLRNSIYTLLNRYNRDREELSVLTAPYAEVVPGRLEAPLAINARERPDIIIKINAIESLITSTRELLETTKPLAEEVSRLFPGVANRIAGKKFKVKFEDVQQAPPATLTA